MEKLRSFVESHRRLFNLFNFALPVCGGIAIWGIANPTGFASAAEGLIDTTFSALDWFFVGTVSGMLGICLWLTFGRYAKVKLGAEDDEPEFSTLSWLAMLFAAGMGVGLVFWGVAEPIVHYSEPIVGGSKTLSAARRALVLTNFHWGFHAWGVYCMAALVLAYFGFRKGQPYLAGAPLRVAFRGWWVGPVAVAADLIAVLSVAFGVAASISMGIFSVQSGLHVVVGVPTDSVMVAIGILVLLVGMYMASAMTGLHQGIKWLSNFNMALAVALLLYVLLAGPTAFLLRNTVSSLGDYVSNLASLSLRLYPYEGTAGWFHEWTLKSFSWWIAWTPFVGVFVARISRGRTIREFILGVLFVPTLFSVAWFGVFGGSGLYEELFGDGGIVRLVRGDYSLGLYHLVDRMPLAGLMSSLIVLLVFVFIVTSVDSATYVLGMLTSRGAHDPPLGRKIAWGVALGVLGAAVLFTGHIPVVRAASSIGAIPFTFILWLQVAAIIRMLRQDHASSADTTLVASAPDDDRGASS